MLREHRFFEYSFELFSPTPHQARTAIKFEAVDDAKVNVLK